MRQSLDLYLTMFLTNALGIVLYEAIFAYSFKRKSKFVLRVVSCVLGIGAIATAFAFGLAYATVNGLEFSLKSVEIIRIVSLFLSLSLGVISLFICFKEKPTLILFAFVGASAAHIMARNAYELWCTLANVDTIYFSMFTGYNALSFVLFYLNHVAILLVTFFAFGKPFAKTAKEFDGEIDKAVVGADVIFSYVAIGIDGTLVFSRRFNEGMDSAVQLVFNGFMMIFCVFVLFVQRFTLVWAQSSQAREEEKMIYENYRRQAEASQKNMELINIKCHDMKHQIRALLDKKDMDESFLEEVQKTISVYDSAIKTGNDAIDVLLTEKSLACEVKKIELSVMIDGEALGFLSPSDINSLFGNAVDNAVEYLDKVGEDKRFIRISSKKQGEMMALRIENYCEDEITFDKKGLPKTTKEDKNYHGFGVKSIKNVAEKYGGTATFSREGNLFVLTVLFV